MVVAAALLWTLAVVVGLALLVVVALLVLPFEGEAAGAVAFDGDDDDDAPTARGWARARFAWGLVAVHAATDDGVAFRLFGRRVRPGDEDEETARRRAEKKERRARRRAEKKAGKRAAKRARPKRRRHRGDLWRARHALGRALGRVVRALHLRGSVSGTVGLDDPADLGTLLAVLNGLTANQRWLDVAIAPDWVDETVRLRGRLAARFRLGAFAWIALATALDPAVWRALRGRPVAARHTKRPTTTETRSETTRPTA